MKFGTLILLLQFLLVPCAGALDLLSHYCAQFGGQVESGYQCPQSKLKLPWRFCVFNSPSGQEQFFDGCTGPAGGHQALFYPACIKHDLCYHHEPATSGLEQRDCDQEFLIQARTACGQSANILKCERWAQAMFAALRGFGGLAFHCSDTRLEEI